MQGCLFVEVGGVERHGQSWAMPEVAEMCDELAEDGGVAATGSHMEGCGVTMVGEQGISACEQEEVHDRGVPVSAGQMQGCVAIVIGGMDEVCCGGFVFK